jgi:protein gp37
MSKIEWTHKTWNPITGCSRASAGCDHCYAVRQTHRLSGMGLGKYVGLTVVNGAGERHFNGRIKLHYDLLDRPMGYPPGSLVFVNSMSDLFNPRVPFEFVDLVMAVIAYCRRQTFQVLTKHPSRMAEYFATRTLADIWKRLLLDDAAELAPLEPVRVMLRTMADHEIARGQHSQTCWLNEWPLQNLWIGTSIEDVEASQKRLPTLLKIPANVRFVSLEPLLGPLDMIHEVMWQKENFCGQCVEWYDTPGDEDHCPNCGHDYLTSEAANNGRGDPVCPKCGEEDYESICPECGKSSGNGGLDSSDCFEIEISDYMSERLHWVIVGGESGPGARPMDPAWVEAIRGQCDELGIPFFFKQWGGVRKGAAGRELNGRTYDEMPQTWEQDRAQAMRNAK